MEFLGSKAPQVELENLNALIITVISINKSEILELNGYDDIYANDESENNVYIVCFTYVT